MYQCRIPPLTGRALRAVRFRDPKLKLSQTTFATLRSHQEFSPDTLYSEYPSPNGLRHDSGRIDDVIIFHQRREAVSDHYGRHH